MNFFSYNPETDILLVKFLHGKIKKTKKITYSATIDLDKNDTIINLELLNFAFKSHSQNPPPSQKRNLFSLLLSYLIHKKRTPLQNDATNSLKKAPHTNSTPPNLDPQYLFTPSSAATITGLTKQTILKAIKTKKLKAIQVNGIVWIINKKDLYETYHHKIKKRSLSSGNNSKST